MNGERIGCACPLPSYITVQSDEGPCLSPRYTDQKPPVGNLSLLSLNESEIKFSAEYVPMGAVLY